MSDAENMQASDEQKAALKAEHAKVYPIELEVMAAEKTVEFLVRAPSKPEFTLFMKASADEETRVSALKKLSRPCILWPEKAELDALIAEAPGVLESLAAPLLKLAGLASAEAGKAL